DKEDPRNKAAIAERAAGYQAFYEHMPVRAPRPQGPDLKLYRSVSYGGLASFFVLDTRQYRSPEVPLCGEISQTPSGYCPASVDPSRTMLGADQRGWLLKGLSDSTTAWNFVTQCGSRSRTRIPTLPSTPSTASITGWATWWTGR